MTTQIPGVADPSWAPRPLGSFPGPGGSFPSPFAGQGTGEGQGFSPAPAPPGSAPAPEEPQRQAQQFVDYFRRMAPAQKGMIYQQVKAEMAEAPSAGDVDAPVAGANSPATPMPTLRPSTQTILQIHDSYLVTQDEQGILIIDQHALHERVIFQTLLERIGGAGKLESQRMLTPATLPGNPRRMATLEAVAALLEKLGIEASAMGPATIGVFAFPSLLFDRGVETAGFVGELLDTAEGDDFSPDTEAALHKVLDMMACKAAIKAGDAMSPAELEALLKRRAEIERSSSCPHGRPTAVRLSLHDLEKQFKRV